LARCRPRLATLSGDQRNRAALAALILVQYFLLLDEPTNNLDMPSAGL
jgi:ATPase subunit of ABC transporter with duplicated ATPase domains